MRHIALVWSPAVLLNLCLLIVLCMDPYPPDYTAWERSLCAHLAGVSALLLAEYVLVTRPQSWRSLAAAVLWCTVPTVTFVVLTLHISPVK